MFSNSEFEFWCVSGCRQIALDSPPTQEIHPVSASATCLELRSGSQPTPIPPPSICVIHTNLIRLADPHQPIICFLSRNLGEQTHQRHDQVCESIRRFKLASCILTPAYLMSSLWHLRGLQDTCIRKHMLINIHRPSTSGRLIEHRATGFHSICEFHYFEVIRPSCCGIEFMSRRPE